MADHHSTCMYCAHRARFMHVHIHMHIHMHIHIHTCTCTYTYPYAYTNIHAHTYILYIIYIYTHAHIHAYTHINVHIQQLRSIEAHILKFSKRKCLKISNSRTIWPLVYTLAVIYVLYMWYRYYCHDPCATVILHVLWLRQCKWYYIGAIIPNKNTCNKSPKTCALALCLNYKRYVWQQDDRTAAHVRTKYVNINPTKPMWRRRQFAM